MDFSELLMLTILYLNCAFGVFLIYIFLESMFQVKEDYRWVKLLNGVACVTLMFFVNSFKLPWLNLIFVPIVYLIFAKLNFNIRLKYAILYVIFYYIILAGMEFVFSNAYKLFEIDTSKAAFGRVMFLIIQDIFEFIIIQLIIKQHRVSYEGDSYRYLKNLYFLPIATLILLNGYLVPDKYIKIGYLLVGTGALLLILSIMVNFSMVERLLCALSEAKETELLNMKTRLERIHIQRLEEINQDYARNIHEMNRVIRIIEQLSSVDDSKAVKKLSMEFSEGFQLRQVYNGDPITNAILLEREKMAEDCGVNFNLDIQQGLNLDFIDDLDKIKLFGNLLDNALEAADKVENGSVSVSLYMGNDAMVIFRVENNFKIKPEKRGNEYITIKKVKKEHGFGLKMVEELAEKYGGIFNCTEKKDTFIAMLILSNMSNAEIY